MKSNVIKVKVMEMSNSFVSFRYLSSNAKSRMKTDKFMEECEHGTLEVQNPSILDSK